MAACITRVLLNYRRRRRLFMQLKVLAGEGKHVMGLALPFALMPHPFYTSVALLVIPGLGLALDTWVGVPIGAAQFLPFRLLIVQHRVGHAQVIIERGIGTR